MVCLQPVFSLSVLKRRLVLVQADLTNDTEPMVFPFSGAPNMSHK